MGGVGSVALTADLQTIGAMMRRSANELIRVPGAAIPGVLAPTIFFLGLTAAFGSLIELRGFDVSSYQSFLIPVSMLQGAGFTGAAAGVNLARDIEIGLFDRFLASPAPRWVLIAGTVLSASVRSLIPATVLLVVALIVGADFPGARRPAARLLPASCGWRSSPPAGESPWRSGSRPRPRRR